MQTEAMKYSIELFDGKNGFALWQSTVKDVLTCQGLDATLEETKPAEMKDSDWSTIQKKAANQIRLALAPEVKYNVLSETTPIGMWKKLEEIYASKSLINRLRLKMELYQLKMAESTNIHRHLSDFNMMVTQVVNARDVVEEEEKALLLLASLSKSYKSLVQSMLVGKTTLVMKDVTSMLLENDKFLREDDKFLGEDDGANQTNALVMEHSRGRSNGCGGGGNRERSKSRPKKDYGEVYQETKDKGEANIVEENVDEVLACEECDLEVEQNNQRWILDSAATMHVCNNPSEFGSLVWGELGKITVATGEKVNIEGIGDVCLNIHNGRAKILKNVRYVPKCSSNIIALSELTTRGCKYVGKREWCKVYKGGRLVLRGRKNKHNIYVLEQHPERRLNKTMRKMVWKPKGILVDGKEINKTKKKVSFNNEVVFGDGSRRTP
ncbi:hypothetical protein SLEP1_g55320 [Rubroshorea leprosula]|uniref:Retrovirus-related Pol polyprotein from transposon TNT 1-94-like beta-barrel domain-containing protein n=1 Tax=Rubroshorea leprosula TaxID=152421 RepID=A0AAV5MG86_9ROSI|nr:hypothetical protein SLEP1_g55320 [Rubroshorea leprosula]